MKKLVLTLMIFLGAQIAVNAQAIVSAYTSLESYRNYKELKSLEKAREFIDEGIAKLEADGSADVPGKLSSKAFYYKGLIYQECAAVADRPDLSDGALQTAATAYTKSIELDDKNRYKNDCINGLLLLSSNMYSAGHNAFKGGDYEKSYSLFSSVKSINELAMETKKPGTVHMDTLSIVATALSAERSGRNDEAISLYNNLLDLDYKDASIYFTLAGLYRNTGDNDKANEVLAKGREAFPDSKELVIEEVNFLLKEGKQAEAITKMEEAIALDTENSSLYFALATAYDSQKNEAKAVENYSKAIELKEDYFDAYYNLGALYFNQAAEKTKLANELDLNQQKEYDAYMSESKGLFEKALPYFEKGLSVNDKDLNTLIALKEIYANLGDMVKSGEFKKRYEELGK